MSYEDGSWTNQIHFPTFVTYIFDFFLLEVHFKCNVPDPVETLMSISTFSTYCNLVGKVLERQDHMPCKFTPYNKIKTERLRNGKLTFDECHPDFYCVFECGNIFLHSSIP